MADTIKIKEQYIGQVVTLGKGNKLISVALGKAVKREKPPKSYVIPKANAEQLKQLKTVYPNYFE